jgi:hypothetical protein
LKGLLIASALLLAPFAAVGQQPAAPVSGIHAEILQIYDFAPHSLEKAQFAQKSAVLDKFWSKAKSHRDTYVPGLRAELTDFSNPPFFLFDGSSLLLTLSDDPADRKIAAAALARSDLRDVTPTGYFYTVHKLATEGADTTAPAFHILDDPKFQVIVPEHALTLGQDYCLIYMLLPTSQDFWLQPAIDRLRAEKDETAQKSLLLLVWYAQTPESDKAVLDISTDATKPAALRSAANTLAHRKDAVNPKDSAIATASSEASLREDRRKRMAAVSDEALDDLDEYTRKIIAKRK